ncbi:C3a anaphylatoxin chemotactic receptor-like [Engystomops pustulosus]|uniref:C3a anaphylatoxin chemotactic receptor-like n=1 Tax=Engystomops pustulosus TaxID=76066 RepID=UPI003AFA6CAD
MDPTEHNLTSPDTTLNYLKWLCNEDYGTNITIPQGGSNEMDILTTVAIMLYSIIFLLGIIGNGLVIWISAFRMKRIISAVWFLNLAIADFLCCASIPMIIADWASDDVCSSSLSSEIVCSLNITLFNINMSASVLILMAMSFDRWVSVMWPFWAKVHRTLKLARITAGIIWGLSFIWTGVMPFYFSFDNIYSKCTTKTIKLIRFVLMFLIPFLIICTNYATIILKIQNSSRPQRSQRLYRIITAVILCFFICWSPYYTWPLIPVEYVNVLQFMIVDIIISCLVYLNSCMNPIIYMFMGQDFRHSFLRSIPIRLERALSEHPDDPHEEEDHEHTTDS